MFTLACHKLQNYLTLLSVWYPNKKIKNSAISGMLVHHRERHLSAFAELLIPVHTCQGLYSRPLKQFGRVILLIFKILFIFIRIDSLLFPASTVLVRHVLRLYYKNKRRTFKLWFCPNISGDWLCLRRKQWETDTNSNELWTKEYLKQQHVETFESKASH